MTDIHDPAILLEVLEPVLSRVRRDVSAVRGEGGMWRSDDALTRARVLSHIESGRVGAGGAGGGGVVRGAYLVAPGQSVCRAAVLDLDDHADGSDAGTGWEEMVRTAARVIRAGRGEGLVGNPWRSRGGRGVHIWYLWDAPQDARSVRIALEGVLRACMLRGGAGGVARGEVEIFPKQDSVGEGGYGNQVWLPLGGKSVPLVADADGALEVGGREWLAGVVSVAGWRWEMSSDVAVVARPEKVQRAPVVRDEATSGERVREAREWLGWVKDYSYDQWLRVGMCLHHGLGGSAEGLALWEEWSLGGDGFEDGACAAKWGTFRVSEERDREGKVLGLGSLRMWARDAGWVPDVSGDFEVVAGGVNGVCPNHTANTPTYCVSGDPVVQNHPPFERGPNARILPTTSNIMMVLARPDLTGMEVALDGFTDDVMVRDFGGPSAWRGFTDEDYTALKLAIENRGRGFLPVARTELRECLRAKAKENVFDSAQLWLDSLVWDGCPRVERFLSTYWGAQDTEYTRAVGLYMWTAMAGRILVPGHQVDMVPILVGNQGAGKTQGIKALSAEERFCELSFDMKDDDVARKLRGVLVAEIAELRGLGTRDEESIKAFVTRQTEKWVPKWKEFAGTFKRRVVMFGTTNDTEFLGDITGNRRWLPFNVGARAGRSDADVRPDLVTRDRGQLWAEARELFKAHGVLWEAAETLAKGEHAAFMTSHPWEDAISEWIRDYAEVCLKGSETVGAEESIFVSNNQILTSALCLKGRVSGSDGRALAKVMSKLGFRKMTRDHGRTRGWGRPKTPSGDR